MEANWVVVDLWSWASFRVTNKSHAAFPASSLATSISQEWGEDDDVDRQEDVVDRASETRPLATGVGAEQDHLGVSAGGLG